MDCVTDVIRVFRDAVLDESRGTLLDIGATPQETELYSRHNAQIEHVIATHHHGATVGRILDHAPSRPRVNGALLDLGAPSGGLRMLPILVGAQVDIAFWRLDMVCELARVVGLLADHMLEGGVVYVYHIDREMARQRAMSGAMQMYGDSVRFPDGTRKPFPSCTIGELDAACANAGMRLLFREYLQHTARRMCMNVLPADEVVCSIHVISAYSVPLHM